MTTIKFFRKQFLFLIVPVAVMAAFIGARLDGAETPSTDHTSKPWMATQAGQLVFFAVLEGLYHDGVSNDDVDLIIPPGKTGYHAFNSEHFVYACPLCHPAFDAFCLYRQRADFFGFKMPTNTLGPGLDQTVRTQLRSPDADVQRKAIQDLISRWVRQRMEMMRLTDAERETITREMEQGRKQGMGMLQNTLRTLPAGESRTNCPICDGSVGACKLSAH